MHRTRCNLIVQEKGSQLWKLNEILLFIKWVLKSSGHKPCRCLQLHRDISCVNFKQIWNDSFLGLRLQKSQGGKPYIWFCTENDERINLMSSNLADVFNRTDESSCVNFKQIWKNLYWGPKLKKSQGVSLIIFSEFGPNSLVLFVLKIEISRAQTLHLSSTEQGHLLCEFQAYLKLLIFGCEITKLWFYFVLKMMKR